MVAPLRATIASAISAHQRPTPPKKSWAPLVHAATVKVRKEFREAYGWFVAAYSATRSLQRGHF